MRYTSRLARKIGIVLVDGKEKWHYAILNI